MKTEVIVLLAVLMVGGFVAYQVVTTQKAAAAPGKGTSFGGGFNFSKFGV